jgi:hypothetical protein
MSIADIFCNGTKNKIGDAKERVSSLLENFRTKA